MKSWKTTVVGIIAAIIFAIGEFNIAIPVLGSWGEVIGILGGIAGIGWFARDNDRTSADVGADKASEARKVRSGS